MKMIRRKEGEEREVAIPTQEFENYRLAQAAESEVAGKINGLQARLGSLTEQAENLQGQLAEARDRKAKAIEQLAMATITQVEYDAIKAEIAKIHESIQETGEQISVIQRTLNSVSREVVRASEAVRSTRWAVVQSHVDREAAELEKLVGPTVRRLCCLIAQAGSITLEQQLRRVFPGLAAMDLNERNQVTEAAMTELFNGEV